MKSANLAILIYTLTSIAPGVSAGQSTSIHIRVQPTIEKRSITSEAALAIAQVALNAGKKQKTEVAVAVVDQAGILLVLLRSDYGTEQFVDGATDKAWTAVNFKASTRELFETIKENKEDNTQLPYARKSLFLMGGIPLKDGDRVVGGVGVAGFASGMADDEVAQQAAHAFTKLLKK
jgi:uncharacterized protein GlcG (DUF336 family)